MSKASEWFRRAQEIEEKRQQLCTPPRPTFDLSVTHPNAVRGMDAYLSTSGFHGLTIRFFGASEHTLTPEQAVKFARWILDTFGDGE